MSGIWLGTRSLHPPRVVKLMDPRRIMRKRLGRCDIFNPVLRPQPAFVAERAQTAFRRNARPCQDHNSVQLSHHTSFPKRDPALGKAMTQSILFVCLGNICRSPTAEAVTRAKAAERGLDVTLDSAGTGDWHIGKPPYGPMQAAATEKGYDLSPLRARQVVPADFDAFDLIVVMDDDNAAEMAAVGPSGRVRRFTDYAPQCGTNHVPDPYFTRDFDGALALIEDCADGLLDALGPSQAS